MSRKALTRLCVAGYLLAAAGWWMAWKQPSPAAENGNVAARGTKSATRGSEASALELMSDPRSSRVVAWMVEADATAEKGKPNDAFLRAARATLEDSLYHRRQRDFRLLLDKMRPEDAPAIHQHFKDLERDGRYFPEDYAAFAMRWGQIDGEAAADHWMELRNNPADLANMMSGWGNIAPEKALAWVEKNGTELGNFNLYRPLLVGWINKDAVSATEWLRNAPLEPRQVSECVDGAMLDKIFSDGLAGACEWLGSLPDDTPAFSSAARNGWLAHVSHLGSLDAGVAASAWGHVGNQPWVQASDFANFCQMVAGANDSSLEGFAKNLESNWPAGNASAQFGRWATEDPESAVAAIASLPASTLRDTATRAFLEKAEASDPTNAEVWRQQLEQP